MLPSLVFRKDVQLFNVLGQCRKQFLTTYRVVLKYFDVCWIFSNAFDKVNFAQLFEKLIKRRISAVVLRLILFVYLHQICFIGWNSVESCPFRVKNGVRQGAILATLLFCVYLDSLFNQLRDAGIGCHLAVT